MECNMSCRYCYARTRSSESMNFAILSKLLKEASKLDAKVINCIWHGGEPLLLGITFYEKAVKLQKEISDCIGIRFINKIQTNGVLVDDAFAYFFAINDFQVGISLDGPRGLHDSNRRLRGGLESYDKAIEGYYRLQKQNTSIGVMCVVTLETMKWKSEFVDWLLKINCQSISFNLDFNIQSKLLEEDWTAEYAEFLLYVENECSKQGLDISIRELIRARNCVNDCKNKTMFCSHIEPCFLVHSTIVPNGDIYLGCDRFVYGVGEKFITGNLFEGGFIKALKSPIYSSYEDQFLRGKRECRDMCPDFDFCVDRCVADWLVSDSMSRSHISECTAAKLSRAILNKEKSIG